MPPPSSLSPLFRYQLPSSFSETRPRSSFAEIRVAWHAKNENNQRKTSKQQYILPNNLVALQRYSDNVFIDADTPTFTESLKHQLRITPDPISPKTVYRLTLTGQRALERYLDHMEALIQSMRPR